MSSVSRPTKAGSHSSHPYREASSLKCKTSSFTLVREKNSEPGLHAASPSYDLFGSSEPQESGYTKLPFTVRRWLGDTEGDRLMANLVVPSTFPDYKVAQGPDDPPASSTDKLSDSNETSASYEARASGRAYTQSGTSFHHIGAWCDEKELRYASIESLTASG